MPFCIPLRRRFIVCYVEECLQGYCTSTLGMQRTPASLLGPSNSAAVGRYPVGGYVMKRLVLLLCGFRLWPTGGTRTTGALIASLHNLLPDIGLRRRCLKGPTDLPAFSAFPMWRCSIPVSTPQRSKQ